KKSAARGKIQCSYCQGLMAASSRIRQTVLRLMGRSSSPRTRWARSVVDCRLRGLPVRAITSQAIEATMARSRGGKGRLAAAAGIVLESEPARGAASPPAADRIGMQIQPGGGRRIGERRVLMEEQDQMSALPEVRRRRASAGESPGLGEEPLREGRAMDRRRAGHE